MQVLEQVKETESLGREFLAWLWFKTETGGGVFDLSESEQAEIWFDGRITLQMEKDLGIETITCVGDYLDMREARFALSEKKEITQAKIKLTIGDNLWSFSLDSGWMNFRSFKTPKVMQDTQEDPEGIFYEKIFLIEEAINAIEIIFFSYIKLRVSPEWESKEFPEFVKWINEIK